MTVAELIAELSKLDSKATVVIDYEYDNTWLETKIVKVYVDRHEIVHIDTVEE